MKWLKQLRDRLSRKKIAEISASTNHTRDFVDLEDARNIGVIVNISHCDAEEIKTFQSYLDRLRKKDKNIFLIELNFLRKSVPRFRSSIHSVFINRKKINWLGKPSEDVSKAIGKYDLDILMNFDASDQMTSQYLCSMARAKTRTGLHVEGLENCYELMIAPQSGSEGHLGALISAFDNFLQMLRK